MVQRKNMEGFHWKPKFNSNETIHFVFDSNRHC